MSSSFTHVLSYLPPLACTGWMPSALAAGGASASAMMERGTPTQIIWDLQTHLNVFVPLAHFCASTRFNAHQFEEWKNISLVVMMHGCEMCAASPARLWFNVTINMRNVAQPSIIRMLPSSIIRICSHWIEYNRIDAYGDRRHLYNLLLYYKMYPNHRLCFLIFDTLSTKHLRIIARMRRTEEYLAVAMDEVKGAWDARHGPHNELPHLFPRKVTGCLDTFPVFISRPKNSWWQTAMYNGKYGTS